MEKRGSFSFLAGVVILLIGTFAVISVITVFMLKASDKEVENLCHDSVLLRVKTTLNVAGTEFKSTPTLCNTIDKKVSGKPEEVKKTFSDLAARCWWMWGEGKYEEIMESKSFWQALGLNPGNPCFVCYSIALDEGPGFTEGNIISGQELIDFAYAATYKNTNQTYLQYLTYANGPGRLLILNHLQPGKAYGIAFAAKNKNDVTWYGSAVKIGGGLALAVGGGALAAYTGGLSLKATFVGLGIASTAIFGSGLANAQKLLTERDVSTIYIDELGSIQSYCYQGDLGGD